MTNNSNYILGKVSHQSPISRIGMLFIGIDFGYIMLGWLRVRGFIDGTQELQSREKTQKVKQVYQGTDKSRYTTSLSE